MLLISGNVGLLAAEQILDRAEEGKARFYAVITIKKIEADQRRPSELMAERLADFLSAAKNDRADFLAAALGERPVDRLKVVG